MDTTMKAAVVQELATTLRARLFKGAARKIEVAELIRRAHQVHPLAAFIMPHLSVPHVSPPFRRRSTMSVIYTPVLHGLPTHI